MFDLPAGVDLPRADNADALGNFIVLGQIGAIDSGRLVLGDTEPGVQFSRLHERLFVSEKASNLRRVSDPGTDAV